MHASTILHSLMHGVLGFSAGTVIPMAAALVCAKLASRASASARHQILLIGATTGMLTPATAWLASFVVAPWSVSGILSDRVVDAMLALLRELGIYEPLSRHPAIWSLIAATWALGAALFIARMVLGLRTVKRSLRNSGSALTGNLAAAVQRVAMPQRIRVVTAQCTMAFTVGWRNPVIVLPDAAAEWSLSTLEHVLAHELAHVRRGDWGTRVLVDLFCALQWFNPLVWLIAREIRFESECASDDMVLATGAPVTMYANELVRIARVMCGDTIARGAIAFASSARFGDRIRALLDDGRSHGGSPRGLRRVVLSSLALAAMLALTIEASDACRVSPAIQQFTRHFLS